MEFLVFLGLIGFLVGLIGLLKGSVRRLRLHNRKVAAAVAVVSLLVMIAASTGLSEDTVPTTPPGEEQVVEPSGEEEAVAQPAQPAEPKVEPKPEPKPTVKKYPSGTYVVGKDIQPGRYRSDGSITYWARLSGFSGELKDIIANGAFPKGPVIVDIKPGDAGFETRGTGQWYRIDDSYVGEKKTKFGDGMYIVGVDILPGRYQSETGANYWARLAGFSGELGDIIANQAFAQGSVIVEIKSSDVGFETSGATWSRID